MDVGGAGKPIRLIPGHHDRKWIVGGDLPIGADNKKGGGTAVCHTSTDRGGRHAYIKESMNH